MPAVMRADSGAPSPAGLVIMLMTPPEASAPYNADMGPRMISIRSTSSTPKLLRLTLPNLPVRGRPSNRMRTALPAFGTWPLTEIVEFAPDVRASTPTDCLSTSVRDAPENVAMSCGPMTSTLACTSEIGCSLRPAVTTTVSNRLSVSSDSWAPANCGTAKVSASRAEPMESWEKSVLFIINSR